MTFMVEIISQETVKPSSSTPHHLRTLNLSLLDQYVPPFHFPLLVFYSSNDDDDDDDNNHKATPAGRLKGCLSEILTHFYPLAGRIQGNFFIDCNDEGVNFFETRVNTCLSQVMSTSVSEELEQLLPSDNFSGLGPKVLLSIQLNMFVCNGHALGVCMSHKAGDASSLALFLSCWALLSRGGVENGIIPPKFDLTSFFHPREAVTPLIPIFGATKKVVSKRFVFDALNIASLKGQCLNVEKPTRVQVVSALIWRCAMKSGSMVQFAVNLRKRFLQPLSDLYVGNLAIAVDVTSETEEIQPELQFFVSQLHNAIAKIDGAFIQRLQADGGLGSHFESNKDVTGKSARGKIELLSISSWCRFPFYECDFGCGTPEWISSVNSVCPNIVILMDTKCGCGVEALIALSEEDMVRFESELHDFISTDY